MTCGLGRGGCNADFEIWACFIEMLMLVCYWKLYYLCNV